MGQYYYPTLFKQHGSRWYSSQYYAHEYGATEVNGYVCHEGLKLTEHGYIEDVFVETVLTQLYNNPQRVYWCGDYYEKDDFELTADYNRMVRTWKKYRVEKQNYPHPKEVTLFSENKIIINHTKKCFIDMSRYCTKDPTIDWILHPLVLLTAVGNGRGGGDYYGVNEEDVGIWAGDLIEIKDSLPENLQDYTDCTNDVWFEED